MLRLIGVGRLGRDCEIRYLNDGTPVTNLSVAWNYGRKGDDGKRPTQWAELALYGERAEKLSPWLLKGQSLNLVVGDVHIETFEGRNGPGSKLVGRIESIDLVGSVEQRSEGGQAAAPAPAQRQQQRPPAPAPVPRQAPAPTRGGSGFDDMDSDIPF